MLRRLSRTGPDGPVYLIPPGPPGAERAWRPVQHWLYFAVTLLDILQAEIFTRLRIVGRYVRLNGGRGDRVVSWMARRREPCDLFLGLSQPYLRGHPAPRRERWPQPVQPPPPSMQQRPPAQWAPLPQAARSQGLQSRERRLVLLPQRHKNGSGSTELRMPKHSGDQRNLAPEGRRTFVARSAEEVRRPLGGPAGPRGGGGATDNLVVNGTGRILVEAGVGLHAPRHVVVCAALA
jgi:hypothetical protein